MKRVIKASEEKGRYMVQWYTHETDDEDSETEWNFEYASSATKAVALLHQKSDEVSGLRWAGGLIDDVLMNKTIYEITSDYTVYDNRRDED